MTSPPQQNASSAASSSDQAQLHAVGASVPRVMVVGDSALAAHVQTLASTRALPLQITIVPGYLAALGELAQHPAHVILGHGRDMRDMVAQTIAALRGLAPHARLVISYDPQDIALADELNQAGCDHVPVTPFDDDGLVHLLHDVAGTSRAPAAGMQHDQAIDQLLAQFTTHEASASPATSSAMPTQVSDESTAISAKDQGNDAQAGHGASDMTGDELGDVDLLEAILAGQGALKPMALRLIEHQSGLHGIALAAQQSEVPGDAVHVPVTFNGQSLGYLHGPATLNAMQLQLWADWLARWLMMQRQHEQFKALAMRDELTNTWNRRYFNRFLTRVLQRAEHDRSQVTLLVFDIDNFKRYNDQYGHAAGDEILRETARLMQSVVREHDVVARIGGDEFAVIFWDAERPRRAHSKHPQDVIAAARRFQQAICNHRFPKLLDEAAGNLTISGGLASFPWDGRTPEQLLERADAMAMRSKQQGKNAITFGPGGLQ